MRKVAETGRNPPDMASHPTFVLLARARTCKRSRTAAPKMENDGDDEEVISHDAALVIGFRARGVTSVNVKCLPMSWVLQEDYHGERFRGGMFRASTWISAVDLVAVPPSTPFTLLRYSCGFHGQGEK